MRKQLYAVLGMVTWKVAKTLRAAPAAERGALADLGLAAVIAAQGAAAGALRYIPGPRASDSNEGAHGEAERPGTIEDEGPQGRGARPAKAAAAARPRGDRLEELPVAPEVRERAGQDPVAAHHRPVAAPAVAGGQGRQARPHMGLLTYPDQDRKVRH